MTELQGRVDARRVVKLPLTEPERAALARFLEAKDAATAAYFVATDGAYAAAPNTLTLLYSEREAWRRGDESQATALRARRLEIQAEWNAKCAQAGAAHDAAVAAARDAYAGDADAHPLVLWIETSERGGTGEADEVLDMLAEGYKLGGVIDAAEERGWCSEFDAALQDAHSVFDIVD